MPDPTIEKVTVVFAFDRGAAKFRDALVFRNRPGEAEEIDTSTGEIKVPHAERLRKMKEREDKHNERVAKMVKDAG